MIKKLTLGLAVSLALGSAPAFSHHSFSATFTDETITVQGEVTRVKFANPHVLIYFDVTDENGETTNWVTEGFAATLLRGQGWSNDTVKEGDSIRVTGNSSRNGSPMVSTEEIVFIDPVSGRVTGIPGQDGGVEEEVERSTPMLLADGRPNLSGAWGHAPNQGGARGERGAGGPGGERGAGGDRAQGGPGDGPRRGGGDPIPFTEAGAALQAQWDPANDPQVQCEAPGLIRQASFTPHPFKIEQHDDYVQISYEEYGGVRTVYFDDRDLVGGEHTRMGQSIARYEDDKLIIETTHLLANPTGPGGNYLSDQATVVETYYRKPDQDGQSIIVLESTINDPEFLTAPWVLTREKYYASSYDFIAVDCQVPL